MEKKLIRLNILIAGFLLILIPSSCKKTLDLSPKSSFDEDFVFGTVENARSAVMAAYSRMSPLTGYGSRLSMMYPFDSDEMINGSGATITSDDNVSDLVKYNVSPANLALSPSFNMMYTGIEYANICIKHIPEMALYENGSDAQKRELRRLHGEALTLRAQYYLELIRNWGDVPAQFKPSIDMEDLFIPNTNRDSTYDHLLEDLALASDLVPWKGEEGVNLDERITKAAVKGMRARIALYRGGYSLRGNVMKRPENYRDFYTIAKDECWDIMQRTDIHNLHPHMQSLFKDVMCVYKVDPLGEMIFEVGMRKEFDSYLGYYNGPRFYVPGVEGQRGNNSVKGTPVYFYSFDPLDTRRDVTLAPYNMNIDNTKAGKILRDISSAKFRVDWIVPARTTITAYMGLNWPLLRLSDVLLMFAEADNELSEGAGPSADAITAFEKVRKRAFVGNEEHIGVTPTDYLGFFNAIVNERLLEFGGEGIRKYDLIRWNLLAEKLVETRAKYMQIINREAPYDQLPLHMFYKEGENEMVWGNSFYEPSPTTMAGYVKINWTASLTQLWAEGVGRWFEPNKSELKPFPQSARESNPKLEQNYGYPQ